MSANKIINIGSRVFFSEYPDYIIHDWDELHLITVDNFQFNSNSLRMFMRGGKKDIVLYRDISKEEMLDDCQKDPLKIGKFLVPEFIDYKGVTISDLKGIGDIFNRLDSKHQYLKFIWGSYIENGDFYLTDDQRLNAYNEYKRERSDIYNVKQNN